MAASGNPQQNFKKVYGALKDSTKVGLAIVNSGYKDLDIAIVKATNHLELPPKEKHVKTILCALSASRSREDATYCIHVIAKRLAKTHTWAVALKILIVIHRALRELGPTIHTELINYSQSRALVLNMSHFRDESTPNAWYFSIWVRAFALYLEERLECFSILKYDVVTDSSKIKNLSIPDLLEQLPALQQLLFRLLGCQPEGVTRYNSLVQYTLSIIAGESVNIFVAITAGTLSLLDKYFELERHDAVRALEIYRKAGNQAQKLSEFFEICRGLEFGVGQKYIKIEQLPPSFLSAMEDYVREAPQPLMLPWKGKNDEVITPKAIATSLPDMRTPLPRSFPCLQENDVAVPTPKEDRRKSDPSTTLPRLPSEASTVPQVIDLLGLDELSQYSSDDDNNAPEHAIDTPDDLFSSFNSPSLTSQSSDWELALVTAPSSNGAAVADSKLAGGLDLDSLYNNAVARVNHYEAHNMGQVASNPFKTVEHTQGPVYALNSIEPSTGVQIASIDQQHEDFLVQQQQPFLGDDSTKETEPSNPFEILQYTQNPAYASCAEGPPTTSVPMAAAMEQQQEDFTVQQKQPIAGDDPANHFGNPFL